MPSSAVNGKSVIKEFIDSQKDIKVIVDVGCGQGTYAKLLGDKYDYLGIEIFEDYVEKFKLKDLYMSMFIADIYDVARMNQWPKGDCIIFGDVLEHLPKDKALIVLEKALRAFKHVVISIPVDGRVGKVHYGNEAELHLSDWTYEEVESLADWERTAESKKIGVFCK